MNIKGALIVVLQLLSVFYILLSFIYMIYITNFKNNQLKNNIGIASTVFSPLKYLFSDDSNIKKIIIFGLFVISIIIQCLMFLLSR